MKRCGGPKKKKQLSIKLNILLGLLYFFYTFVYDILDLRQMERMRNG